MFNPERCDPTGRFTGLADCYAKFRPSYAPAAIDCLCEECGLTPNSTVVDIGCGTGISTRLLAERGLHVVGVDPNVDMLTTARETPRMSDSGAIVYCQGRAEQTGLGSGIARIQTACFRRFIGSTDRQPQEFNRILEPRGWLSTC